MITHMNSIDNKRVNINKILIPAFIIRITVLVFVLIFSNKLTVGFISDSYINDDVRTEMAAELYTKTATGLIDTETFAKVLASMGDYTGYSSTLGLWDWLVCLVTYITKTTMIMRIINILFAVIGIEVVYKYAQIVYGQKPAVYAAKLLAFLPYPCLFCCFLYKDTFVMLCLFYILLSVARFNYDRKLGFKKLMLTILSVICMALLRSGLTAILLLIVGCIMLMQKNKEIGSKRITLYKIPISIVAFGAICYFFASSIDTIIYKANIYIFSRSQSTATSTISLITINSIKDIYKLPIAYMFSMLMPIRLYGEITSWHYLICYTNIIMTPIAIGNILYLVSVKKTDKRFYWGTLAYYCVSIIASLGIFRHYFSLLPITLINYSDYYKKTQGKKASLVIGTTILTLALLVYYQLLS